MEKEDGAKRINNIMVTGRIASLMTMAFTNGAMVEHIKDFGRMG